MSTETKEIESCEVCGSKEFETFSAGEYNFRNCKKCGAEYLDD